MTIQLYFLMMLISLMDRLGWLGHMPKLRNSSSEAYIQQLATKLRKQVTDEIKDKVNLKVQASLARVLKMLGDANPNFNINIENLCNTSTEEDNGTPITQGAGSGEGANGGATS